MLKFLKYATLPDIIYLILNQWIDYSIAIMHEGQLMNPFSQ